MKATTLALIGVPAALGLAVALVLHDLGHANRPHELRFVPWVGVLAATSVWLAGAAAFELRRRPRASEPERWRTRAGLVLACCGMLPGIALLVLTLFGLVQD